MTKEACYNNSDLPGYLAWWQLSTALVKLTQLSMFQLLRLGKAPLQNVCRQYGLRWWNLQQSVLSLFAEERSADTQWIQFGLPSHSYRKRNWSVHMNICTKCKITVCSFSSSQKQQRMTKTTVTLTTKVSTLTFISCWKQRTNTNLCIEWLRVTFLSTLIVGTGGRRLFMGARLVKVELIISVLVQAAPLNSIWGLHNLPWKLGTPGEICAKIVNFEAQLQTNVAPLY